jgi:hypothetical protein
LSIDLEVYDVIVIHYSIVIAPGYQPSLQLRASWAAALALKMVFNQDEYRWIDVTAAAIRELGISVLFTLVNPKLVEQIYHHSWLKNVRKEVGRKVAFFSLC